MIILYAEIVKLILHSSIILQEIHCQAAHFLVGSGSSKAVVAARDHVKIHLRELIAESADILRGDDLVRIAVHDQHGRVGLFSGIKGAVLYKSAFCVHVDDRRRIYMKSDRKNVITKPTKVTRYALDFGQMEYVPQGRVEFVPVSPE